MRPFPAAPEAVEAIAAAHFAAGRPVDAVAAVHALFEGGRLRPADRLLPSIWVRRAPLLGEARR